MPRKITKKALRERVEFWRARVCPEWRILLKNEPHPDEATDERLQEACAYVQSDLTIAQIRAYFKDEVRTMDEAQRDRVIVHELLHPLLDRVLDHDEALHGYCPPPVLGAMIEQRRGDMEEFVDRMARLIVDPHHGDEGVYYTAEET